MVGENFKRLNRNGHVKELKEKVLKLQEECGKLYQECRDTGNFDSVKHDTLSKQIERLEYLLWGAKNGIIK